MDRRVAAFSGADDPAIQESSTTYHRKLAPLQKPRSGAWHVLRRSEAASRGWIHFSTSLEQKLEKSASLLTP
jgi:hypothetical protein